MSGILVSAHTGGIMQSAIQPVSADHPSKAALWSGRVLTALIVLFMVFDSSLKLLKVPAAVQGTVELGFQATLLIPIGLMLLACVILYAIPRTAVLGAILLTGYFGGAVATQVRVGHPLFLYTLFPVYFGILTWLALYLRLPRLRTLLPVVG